jgi:hypothetical protein
MNLARKNDVICVFHSQGEITVLTPKTGLSL